MRFCLGLVRMARELDSMPLCCPCPAGLLQPSYLPRRPHQPRACGGGLARAALALVNMYASLNCTQVKRRGAALLHCPVRNLDLGAVAGMGASAPSAYWLRLFAPALSAS